MNVATLSGRLGKDVEVKYVGNKNTPLATTSLAVQRGFGDSKQTDWYQLKVWGKPGEVVSEYFRKGDMATFSGEIEIEKWDGKDGEVTMPTLVVRHFDFPIKDKNEKSAPKQRTMRNMPPQVEHDDVPF